MRFLGIDYGTKRVGVALSDEDGRFAMPVIVLKNAKNSAKSVNSAKPAGLLKEVTELARENNVKEIVLGESRNYKGEANAILEKSLEFKKALESAGFIVHLEPEFMTSVQAERFQGKTELSDASAAALILQSYLDREKS